jgi:hypothetical protein
MGCGDGAGDWGALKQWEDPMASKDEEIQWMGAKKDWSETQWQSYRKLPWMDQRW